MLDEPPEVNWYLTKTILRELTILILFKFQDPNYKIFAQELHQKWLSLGRKIKPDVKANPSFYSLVYLENPFIVPGGRFRECYYWDSYWTILGLLASEMEATVKGRIQYLV